MAENIDLVIRFHPVGGDDVSVLCTDFADPGEALEAVTRALGDRRGLVLAHAREDREAREHGMVINLANVVSVRVSRTDHERAGPYL
ncbi:hypothetical protein HC028_19355 [Planosporangium flavigriseum]|uniref:Uncharacterized protein n=1 Tax=Planosporangium flavigriseum TaxID=373681 RepID=A0A8J3LKK3_9ACTN|nr:hypothetical protein [Planosporangium flavigriseum]NJC66648.1 hypothetical protein [Planosporangium flavigriseum]GIG73522.1 hypothetical protein Pfl04_19260 [Planosporangium flavigriseum]